MATDVNRQPAARRGRLTVSARARARLLSQTVRDSSPELRTRTLPAVRIRRRRSGYRATVRLAATYPAPLADALDLAARRARLVAERLPEGGSRPVALEITELVAQDGTRGGTFPRSPRPPTEATGHASPPRPSRRWTGRRRAVSLLCALTLIVCGYWCLRQGQGTWAGTRAAALLSDLDTWTAGSTQSVAVASLLAPAGVASVVLAVTGTRVPGWRMTAPRQNVEVTVDPTLVRREVANAVRPLAPGHRPEVQARRRTVRVTPGGTPGPQTAAESELVARAALRTIGLDGDRPRIRVRLRRPPKTTPAGSGPPADAPSEAVGTPFKERS
ncbi:hypothetical protein [Kitasatospora purpeofusca]|uniref:hypothetical protein n=1 Tax=Kitasatospora purpeofusca TaxID=67352 RepID=UPI00382A2B86